MMIILRVGNKSCQKGSVSNYTKYFHPQMLAA